jgi:hypothetical protein
MTILARTIGLSPGDPVLLIGRHGEQQIVRHGLALSVSMRPELAGSRGEASIRAAYAARLTPQADDLCIMLQPNVVHISHRDWLEGRAAMAYEELPHPLRGVCCFCGCTDQRSCAGGCGWLNEEETMCSADACREKARAFLDRELYAVMEHVMEAL